MKVIVGSLSTSHKVRSSLTGIGDDKKVSDDLYSGCIPVHCLIKTMSIILWLQSVLARQGILLMPVLRRTLIDLRGRVTLDSEINQSEIKSWF